MPDLTWKSVMLIWMLALPFVGGVGFLLYQQDPKPFDAAAAWAVKTGGWAVEAGQKAYQDHQAREDAKKDAQQAAKEAPKKAEQVYTF